MLLLATPLLWAAVPALVDYPDHLARIWIITHTHDIPALAANYSVHWRVLPNLALDIVASALAQKPVIVPNPDHPDPRAAGPGRARLYALGRPGRRLLA